MDGLRQHLPLQQQFQNGGQGGGGPMSNQGFNGMNQGEMGFGHGNRQNEPAYAQQQHQFAPNGPGSGQQGHQFTPNEPGFPQHAPEQEYAPNGPGFAQHGQEFSQNEPGFAPNNH